LLLRFYHVSFARKQISVIHDFTNGGGSAFGEISTKSSSN
jgi:hypothetical protein